MEKIILILAMAGVFIFGFFVVSLFDRSWSEGRQGRLRRPPWKQEKQLSSKVISLVVLTARGICDILGKKNGGA